MGEPALFICLNEVSAQLKVGFNRMRSRRGSFQRGKRGGFVSLSVFLLPAVFHIQKTDVAKPLLNSIACASDVYHTHLLVATW